MFTKDVGATATYRTLARGSGGGWARAYHVSQQDRAGRGDARRRDQGTSIASSAQASRPGSAQGRRRRAAPSK